MPYDIEAKPDEPVLHVHGVYVSIDEKDDGVVTWVTSWLLPLLEDRGHNSLSVYFPLRQEVPGVFKAEVCVTVSVCVCVNTGGCVVCVRVLVYVRACVCL